MRNRKDESVQDEGRVFAEQSDILHLHGLRDLVPHVSYFLAKGEVLELAGMVQLQRSIVGQLGCVYFALHDAGAVITQLLVCRLCRHSLVALVNYYEIGWVRAEVLMESGCFG